MAKPLVHQILVEAFPLIDNKRTRTAGALARTGNGDRCDPLNPDAVRFCAFGAITLASQRIVRSKRQAKRLATRAAAMLCPEFADEETALYHLGHVNDAPRGRISVLARFRAQGIGTQERR